jgi:hypothetical protein
MFYLGIYPDDTDLYPLIIKTYIVIANLFYLFVFAGTKKIAR